MPLSGNYSAVDRALHYLAFSVPFLQRALGDLESDLLRRRLDGVVSRDEVFVTGLPRAGTTLLLELLHGTGEFETFTYRHMPFVLAPLIWSRLSKPFRKAGAGMERAHGDGMSVSVDSPEAFEEVVWLAYLRGAVVGKRTLSPVSRDMLTGELADAMRASVRKLLALSPRSGDDAGPSPRYLSKNNANISRLDAVTTLFPTSRILVVFREPRAHVGSLRTQHARFRSEHAQDRFSRRYMEWIGHYEFGASFKPINFSGWLDDEAVPPEPDESFWTRYWTMAYTYALEHATENVRFVDFDRLLAEREPYLERIAEAAALQDTSALTRAADGLRAPTTKPIDTSACSPEIRRAAEEVHSRLRAAAV